MITPRWIELDGAANMRDVGGLPTDDGERVAPGRLIRSDNLQRLSAADVRRLVDELGVRSVVDLRTGVEVAAEGPGPLTREPTVAIRHLSLFPEAGETTDVDAAESGHDPGDPNRPIVLPWQGRDRSADAAEPDERLRGASGVYLRYLGERPDSIIAALRTIAEPDGATIVHCAAGKDRTGTVVAFALSEVGVTRGEVVADYARSAERVEAIVAALRASPTYADDLSDDLDHHRVRASTMSRMLSALDEFHGGVPGWLRANGWTSADADALRHRLLTP